LGSSQAQTNITAARIKTKQRRPRRTKQKKQEELSGQEPEEKSREEEGNFRPVAFREYHLTAEILECRGPGTKAGVVPELL
jgi:hypothetical protein